MSRLARTSGGIVRPGEVHVHQLSAVREPGHPVAGLGRF
jgi:hypothetical protein